MQRAGASPEECIPSFAALLKTEVHKRSTQGCILGIENGKCLIEHRKINQEWEDPLRTNDNPLLRSLEILTVRIRGQMKCKCGLRGRWMLWTL
jgi:hypothetical protein